MVNPRWMSDAEDAKKLVTINIRQQDIEGADALNGERCVAARCTLRALDANAVYFFRSKAYVQWDEGGKVLRYQLSQTLVKNVIEILDDPHRSNSDIVPGTYSLLPPPPAQRLGKDRSAKNPGSRAQRKDRGHRIMGRVTAARVG